MINLWRAVCSCGKASPRFGVKIGANMWGGKHTEMGHSVTVENAGSGDPWSPV